MPAHDKTDMLQPSVTPPNPVLNDSRRNIPPSSYDLGMGEEFEEVLAGLLQRGGKMRNSLSSSPVMNITHSHSEWYNRKRRPSTPDSWPWEVGSDDYIYGHGFGYEILPSSRRPRPQNADIQFETENDSGFYQRLLSSPLPITPTTPCQGRNSIWACPTQRTADPHTYRYQEPRTRDSYLSSFPLPPSTPTSNPSSPSPNSTPLPSPTFFWSFSPSKPKNPAASENTVYHGHCPLSTMYRSPPPKRPFFRMEAIRRYASADSLRRNSHAEIGIASERSSQVDVRIESACRGKDSCVAIAYEDAFCGPPLPPSPSLAPAPRFRLRRKLAVKLKMLPWFPVRGNKESSGGLEEKRLLPKRRGFRFPFALFGSRERERGAVWHEDGDACESDAAVVQFLAMPGAFMVPRQEGIRERV